MVITLAKRFSGSSKKCSSSSNGSCKKNRARQPKIKPGKEKDDKPADELGFVYLIGSVKANTPIQCQEHLRDFLKKAKKYGINLLEIKLDTFKIALTHCVTYNNHVIFDYIIQRLRERGWLSREIYNHVYGGLCPEHKQAMKYTNEEILSTIRKNFPLLIHIDHNTLQKELISV